MEENLIRFQSLSSNAGVGGGGGGGGEEGNWDKSLLNSGGY